MPKRARVRDRWLQFLEDRGADLLIAAAMVVGALIAIAGMVLARAAP